MLQTPQFLIGIGKGGLSAIALDSAASSFYSNGVYDLHGSGLGQKSTAEMISMAKEWQQRDPIISWEDPLDENDWDGFTELTKQLGAEIEVVGDDIFVTNTKYISRGIELHAANSALIKLNQIGTVSETIEACRMCRDAGWRYFISHRSGETTDTFLADFAVAMDGGHLKSGSASRGERIAKYNRLLEIEKNWGMTPCITGRRNEPVGKSQIKVSCPVAFAGFFYSVR